MEEEYEENQPEALPQKTTEVKMDDLRYKRLEDHTTATINTLINNSHVIIDNLKQPEIESSLEKKSNSYLFHSVGDPETPDIKEHASRSHNTTNNNQFSTLQPAKTKKNAKRRKIKNSAKEDTLVSEL